MDNQFKIDYAYPGLCSLCHIEVADFKSSGGPHPIVTKLKSIYREAKVKLDDGSDMRISLCENCYENLKPTDMQVLMESEINGWQKDVDRNKNKDIKQKKKYMTKYSKRYVLTRVDKPWSLEQNSKIKKPRKSKLKIVVEKEK